MTEQQSLYNWIMNIIDSCNNDFHFEAADKLIELFEQRVKNQDLVICLKQQRERHWNSIHSILK